MFNGPKLTKHVRELLLSGDFVQVEEILYKDLREFPDGERNRIKQLRKLYDGVKREKERLSGAGEEKVNLQICQKEVEEIERFPKNLFTLNSGFYSVGKKFSEPGSFEEQFKNESEQTRKKLTLARFHVPVDAGNYDDLGILDNVSICGAGSMMHAYAFGEDLYLNEESARLAKACTTNSRKVIEEEIPRALLLPIPHHPGNYYHVMAEMVYGLRFAHRVAKSIPIIYQQDDFGLLPPICRRLGINTKRLLSFEEVAGCSIKQAVLPGQPPYYWNSNVFDFFGNLVQSEECGLLNLYISRSNGSRGPSNERDLEVLLSRKGFIIIHAESLSIEQQMLLFSMAGKVVAPHGAGLTNIAFMKKGSFLLELFPSHMLIRDFYMRSKHNDMSYKCFIYEDEIDVKAIEKLISDT
ncbi:glycosyltransferase family 61 protein [Carnimonas bestiolae]|uniref:glycosyltransferase family 61 protein n=1 Tax=Carnimonas bestiolae TaxID=3402172 RepID=UPI003EDC6331